MQRYGSPKPKELSVEALKTINVPISLFYGTVDRLATTNDGHILRDEILAGNVHHYEEIESGHLSLLMGKDMSYFRETAMDIIKEH